MPKGTFQVEATSNSEKIKPVALAIIEICLTEGISQAVSQKEILLTFYYRMANIIIAIYSTLYKWAHNSFVLGATELKLAPNYSVR